MVLEYLLILVLVGGSTMLIGTPIYKFLKTVLPKKRDPLQEAKERLEQARLEAEAARLNKETEKLYNHLYEDVLQENENAEEDKRKKL